MYDQSRNPVVIVGAGGHAKVVADALLSAGRRVIGFTDRVREKRRILGLEVIGDDSVLRRFDKTAIEIAVGVGSIPGQERRWEIIRELRDTGFTLAVVVHKSAVIARDVKISDGAQVMAGVVIQPSVFVGCDSIINTGSYVDHDCVIEDSCHIAPGVTMSGGVRVGKEVHIGPGSSIIQGIEIGERSIIAAGSTVYKSIECDTKFLKN